MAKAYFFTGKKQSVSGIMSTVFGSMALLTLILCISKAYESAGEQVSRLGGSAILSIVFMIVGFILAIKSVFESNCFLIFRILAWVMNILAFLCLSIIMYAGAML